MPKLYKKPKKVSMLEAAKYYARQKVNMSDEVRLKILERVIPKLTNEFSNGRCSLNGVFNIQCEDCPLNTIVNGNVYCDMRAILGLLNDDITKERRKRIPLIPIGPFKEENGVYIEDKKTEPKPHTPDRFDGII